MCMETIRNKLIFTLADGSETIVLFLHHDSWLVHAVIRISLLCILRSVQAGITAGSSGPSSTAMYSTTILYVLDERCYVSNILSTMTTMRRACLSRPMPSFGTRNVRRFVMAIFQSAIAWNCSRMVCAIRFVQSESRKCFFSLFFSFASL